MKTTIAAPRASNGRGRRSELDHGGRGQWVELVHELLGALIAERDHGLRKRDTLHFTPAVFPDLLRPLEGVRLRAPDRTAFVTAFLG
jgi:hypothetical protein